MPFPPPPPSSRRHLFPFLPSRILRERLHFQPENFHQTNPFSAFPLPFGNYYRDSGFTQISSFSLSRFLFHSGAEASGGREGGGGWIGWIRGKQCCGRHRFAAVLTTHFRASSFRGMYFLQRYRPSCCCSRAVSASDAIVSGLSDFDEANVGEWQTSNCIFWLCWFYVMKASMHLSPGHRVFWFINVEQIRLKFFFFFFSKE